MNGKFAMKDMMEFFRERYQPTVIICTVISRDCNYNKPSRFINPNYNKAFEIHKHAYIYMHIYIYIYIYIYILPTVDCFNVGQNVAWDLSLYLRDNFSFISGQLLKNSMQRTY